jgi:hypothetical protein
MSGPVILIRRGFKVGIPPKLIANLLLPGRNRQLRGQDRRAHLIAPLANLPGVAAREVLVVGEMPDPRLGLGEVRIRIAVSSINPGDVKKREDTFGIGMPYPRVIPHSDDSGRVDQVGEGVPVEWVGRAVWCYAAQSHRPFGTAAEYTVVPLDHVAPLPESVSPEQGACLGYPASRSIAPCMSEARWPNARCWCKGREVRSVCVRRRLRVLPARA